MDIDGVSNKKTVTDDCENVAKMSFVKHKSNDRFIYSHYLFYS